MIILLIPTIYLGSTLLLLAMIRVYKKYDASVFDDQMFNMDRIFEIAAYVPLFNTLSILYLLPEFIGVLRQARLTFEEEPEWDEVEWRKLLHECAYAAYSEEDFIAGAEFARRYFDGDIEVSEEELSHESPQSNA